MNGYVLAAWLSCGSLLGLYSLRTLRRERLLRRSLSPEDRKWR
jgi:hypothetical protein